MGKNKIKIDKLTAEMFLLTTKLENLQEELDIVNDDYIDEIKCCKKMWDSKKLLLKHKTTKGCLEANGSKCFNCPRCNIKFFDGYCSLKELLNNPIKLLNSEYKKHVDAGCKTACDDCGQAFNTQYMFRNHKCAQTKDEEVDAYSYTPVKETWDIWRIDGINYDHNLLNNKVYKNSKYIGYIENQLLHFDDPNSDYDLVSGSESEDTKENCLIDDKEIVMVNEMSDEIPIKKKKKKFNVKKKPTITI
tara:strand:- start:584 stop:1324 length:741 start_codon:yes stop_codon:yes gene_type:complete